MENTIKNKAKFFAQYWGQKVLRYDVVDNEISEPTELNSLGSWTVKNSFIELIPLEEITDEDIIEVAKMAHERYNSHWTVRRDDDIIHVEHRDSYNMKYHISMLTKYATVNANMSIPNDDDTAVNNFKINIGEVNMSSTNPIAYIAIVDFLRSKGYAIPFGGLSIQKLLDYGWVKI